MILIINAGSSSIKFTLYKKDNSSAIQLTGQIKQIASPKVEFVFKKENEPEQKIIPDQVNDFASAIQYLINWLEKNIYFSEIKAIGHRIVHGMMHHEPVIISESLLAELIQIIPYAPEHLPNEIKLVEAFKRQYPELIQVACFDTSFHAHMPDVAKRLPLPRRYYEMGIQRYGFHGLSYEYLMEELERIAGNKMATGKVILAHLGNGASIAAVKNGQCMDTSMGFTPASGLVMSTRTGDIDPGIATFLMQSEKLNLREFDQLVNHQSGLLGVSGTTGDMEELLKIEDTDMRSAEAVELFCYQIKKWIGSYTAVLEGLDTLVFSGGIGENAAVIRSRICSGLQFLGVDIDEKKNAQHEEIISSDKSKVRLMVIKTNEELMIARSVYKILNNA